MKISRIGRIPNLNINLPPLENSDSDCSQLAWDQRHNSTLASRLLGEVTLKKKYTRVTYILKRKFKELPRVGLTEVKLVEGV